MTKESKKCGKCGEVKLLGCFHKSNRNRCGLQSQCKACASKWRQENLEASAACSKRYSEENREVRNADNAKRRARKLNATPPWLTDRHHKDIRNIYAKAVRKSKRDSVKYHVDHIVPLQGESVSGLHVPWNLQILTAEENLSKKNKHSDWD